MESSSLMEDLISYMDKKIYDKNYKIKMILDFGHDVTVAPMQLFMYQAFNVDYTVCAFSCNIFFELHKKLSKRRKMGHTLLSEVRNMELAKETVGTNRTESAGARH